MKTPIKSQYKTRARHRGFSLVASIMLMTLLSVIIIGLLSLSVVTLRTTQQGAAQATARANARMAMMFAIGEIQKYTGPDQRVTAAADILDESQNKNWTGVWSTTLVDDPTKPMVQGHVSRDYLSDLRHSNATLNRDQWRENLRLAWLVSGDGTAVPSDSGANMIELVGSGSLGDIATSDTSEVVSAPLVEVLDSASKKAGAYAFWVGDESQKARIDLTTPYDNKVADPLNITAGGYYRLAGAEGPNLADVQSDGGKPYEAIQQLSSADRTKLVSRHTAGVPAGDKDAPRANFHDLTAHSLGVLADVTGRGLKKDLTATIENTAAIPAVSGVPGTGLAAQAQILPGSKYARGGPSFAHLRNWYDLRKSVQNGMLNPTLSTPLFTALRPGFSGSHYNTQAQMPDLITKSQPVQPVMTDFRLAFDFSLDTNPSRANGRAVRLHVYPRVTLWNPYNVTLKGRRYLAGANIPVVYNLNVGGSGLELIDPSPSDNTGKMYPGLTGSLMYFTLDEIDIGPGETLVFSPDITASGGAVVGGNSAKYDTSNIARNVLSAKIPSGTNNFHFDCNQKVPEAVNLASRPNYTFSGGVNQAFGAAPGFQLKQFSGTSSSMPVSSINSSCPTLQFINGSLNGKQSSWWWYLWGGAMDAVNGGAGFQDYNLNPNRYPPRLWAIQGRMRWLDETDEQSGVPLAHGGEASALFYNCSAIAHFNMRATMIHRDPFSFYEGWTKYAPGSLMIPWATPRLNDSRMDLPYRDGKSFGSPLSAPNVFGASPSFALFDVPHPGTPVFSIAQFQHAQLGYQSWQPTYVIGHGIAEPRSSRHLSVNQTFYSKGSGAWGSELARQSEGSAGQWTDLIQSLGSETLIYDSMYKVNTRLWDRFFLSTIPYSNGSLNWSPGDKELPNSRLTLTRQLTSAEESLLTGLNHFDYASYFLMNKGAFNVNSTRVEAWKALFSMLNDIDRPTGSGDSVLGTFSRLLMPMSNMAPAGTASAGTWHGSRQLTPSEIEALATTMVQVVKERGPFLSMADFINRRLTNATSNDFNDPSFTGPLQAAIERAGLNSSLQLSGDQSNRVWAGNGGSDGTVKPDVDAFYTYKTYGAPGYLTQADILQTVGPGLSARGDTFVIRAYGDARDANGNIQARAWCEAVVQRTPDYLQSASVTSSSNGDGNNPLEPVLVDAATSFAVTSNNALLPVNAKFGRRIVLESFRWLSASEI